MKKLFFAELVDMDPSCYTIAPDENSVSIFGAVKFSTCSDHVSFDLVLTRATRKEPEGGAFISFYESELEGAGLGLAYETAEATLLKALKAPGLNGGFNPDAFLTRELIDNYLEPTEVGGYINTASGWSFCGDAYNDERKDCRIDYYAFLTYWAECTEAAATDCSSWADVEDQLSGYVPETALHAVKRWHFFNRTDWANIENLY